MAFARHGGFGLAYDSFRDIGYAHGIASGHPWDDPMIPGLRAWYPPGIPALVAGIGIVSGLDLAFLEATSAYWLGVLLPIALHLTVRASAGRLAAWLALPFVLFGSRWWFLHATLPMSSIQSVAFAWFAVLAWLRSGRQSMPGALVTGALLALTLWCHVLCGAVALGAIAGSESIAWWAARGRPTNGRGVRAAIACGLGVALGAPPVLAQLTMARVNDAPHHWFGPELHDPVFALHARAPLAAAFGVLGLVQAARRWSEQGWLVMWALIGAVGQAFGYLGHDLGWRVPWFLPHEFQWHEQLALMVAGAGAVAWTARRLVDGPKARAVTVAALLVLALGRSALDLPRAGDYLLRLDRRWQDLLLMSAWIAGHTPERSVVVAAPDPAYYVCGLTGRRTVALPPGHLNPAADPRGRVRDALFMLTGADAGAFDSLANHYGVEYLLATNDVAPYDVLRRRFEHWPGLEPVHAQDTTAMLYRIHRR